MSAGRVFASAAAVVAVVAAAAIAVGMTAASSDPTSADGTPFALPTGALSSSVQPLAPLSTGVSSGSTAGSAASPAQGSRSGAAPSSSTAVRSSHPPAAHTSSAGAPSTVAADPTPSRTTPATTVAAPTGSALSLHFSTGSATRVITVVAPTYGSTTATLQAWDKVSGGWRKHGGAVTAHIGSDGMSTHPSESLSATPVGSFTLTQAFGYYSNPGTGLPYFRTNGADWWISEGGPLYNTHQHCSGSCPFTQGAPNEHLAYETPYYNYAVVIDYNRSPVLQGAGSAFFLHVTDGYPTAGCVAIPQSNLVPIMQWLTPSAQPRILIGVA